MYFPCIYIFTIECVWKRGRGKENTNGVFTQVIVCSAGILTGIHV